MTDRIEIIEETIVEGKRLGRHVQHDERSKQFPAGLADGVVSVVHERKVAPFDQGALGSCGGNAGAGVLATAPFARDDFLPDEDTARLLYEMATVLDPYPGQYPPNDTGTSGLAVASAMKNAGFISAYTHAFGIDEALRALSLVPVMTGVLWFPSFDTPDEHGIVHLVAGETPRGAHEFVVNEINLAAEMVGATNSWGPGWGVDGKFWFPITDWESLLNQQGDVTVPVF